MTPLLYAVTNNDLECAKLLLDFLDDPVDPDIADNENNTPLNIAARQGYYHMVKLLLGWEEDTINNNSSISNYSDNNSINKNPNNQNSNSNYSSNSNNNRKRRKVPNPNIKNIHGDAPLNSAIEFKRIECAQILVLQGANIHNKDEDGVTPLHAAIELNDYHLIKLLLEKGINPYQSTVKISLHSQVLIRIYILSHNI